MSDPRSTVQRAVVAYQRDTEKAETSRTHLHDAIRAARAAGVPQTELVQMTGYTREHIRRITNDDR